MRSRSLVAPIRRAWSSSFPFAVACAAACLPAALSAQGTVNATLLQADAAEASSPVRKAGPAGIVAKVRASVVHVAVEISGGSKFVIERASSGFVADPSGLVVTWARLVQEVNGATDKQLFVQLDDAENTRLPAAIVRIDEASGLALLRVSPPAAGLTGVVLGPDRPAAGEPVVVLARPRGKEMPAFGGVASPALGAVTLGGKQFAPADVFLTDSRNDERCDGAPVFDSQGRVIGVYSSEHVQRDKSEPTLEDLKRPSFGVVLPAGRIRTAFAAEFEAVSNASLRKQGGGGDGPMHPNVAAVSRVAPSVVSVWAGDGDWPLLGAKDPGGMMRRDGLGSGVVLSKNGLVVANTHVCKEGEPRIRLADGRTFPAEIVKRHGTTNLSLLQVKLPAGSSLVPAPCNIDDDAVLGEVVLAVGNPLGTQCVVSAGVVSAKRDEEGGRIQSDANLGNQNGGGAVVDVTGRLLGIADAGATDAIERLFARQGDRVSTDVNLSRFIGIRAVRRAFAQELEAAEADAGIRAAVAATEAERKARASALTAMVEKTSGAMLNITIRRNIAVQKEDDPFPPKPDWVLLGGGSGVIIDRSGLALSNWHVVDDATRPDGSMVDDHEVAARVFGGKQYRVKVLSISRENDLSLLQLELEPGEQVHAVELGDSDALAIGEWVAAIGNPHLQPNTITFGLVSAKDQRLPVKGRFEDLLHLIETDAAINGGNSGGALLDMNGRLVGINSAGGGTFNNKGYAIQVGHVRATTLSLLFAAYKLRSPDLGMRVHDEAGKVLVFDTDPRGAAAKAGLKSGDRILKLNDVGITWSPGFALTLLRQPAGVELTLQVERGGEPMAVKVTPVSAAVWAVVRQSGLLTRDFAYAEDAERVRTTAIALHRAFTGDATGEPNVIPANVVVVDKVYAGDQPDGTDLQAGDLLLALELVRADSDTPTLVRLASVDKLRDLWNDYYLGTYQGRAWPCWIARGNEVKKIEVTSKRLFW